MVLETSPAIVIVSVDIYILSLTRHSELSSVIPVLHFREIFDVDLPHNPRHFCSTGARRPHPFGFMQFFISFTPLPIGRNAGAVRLAEGAEIEGIATT